MLSGTQNGCYSRHIKQFLKSCFILYRILADEAKRLKHFVGNSKIHPYPLERLLIFTEKLFENLKKELAQFESNEVKPEKVNVKQKPNVKSKPLPGRITHDYEPSNIWSAYDGNKWRWRRMYDWFNQSTLDDRQNASLKYIIKQLEE